MNFKKRSILGLLSAVACLLSSGVYAVDSNLASRAVIPWGDARYLGTNDDIVCVWPGWMLSAQKIGGEWNTNLPAWVVSAADTNEDWLLMGLDRNLITNDLAMKIDYVDSSNSLLAVDLLLAPEGTNTTNEVVTVSSNLLTGLGISTNAVVVIPFAANTNAVGVRLRRGEGDITVFDTELYIDASALNAASNRSLDSDGDGFTDYEEIFQYGTDPADSNSVPTAPVSGQVIYFGVQSGTVHLLAVTDTNTWSSAHYQTLTFPTPSSPFTYHAVGFILQNLPQRQTYSIRAFIDVNGDGLCDTWEPQGYAVPNITLSGSTNGVFVVLADPDTDADGIPDAAELMLGLNPFVPDLCATLPFLENFETNSVTLGNLNGQNGWRSDVAQVQSNLVKEGSQAVLIDSASPTSMVRQLFARNDSSVMWVDYHTVVRSLMAAPTPTNTIAAHYFDWQGRLMVWDGRLEGTNKWMTITNAAPVAAGSWVRLTVALDFANQMWSIGLNGVMVDQGIGFGHPASELHAFDMTAAWGAIDQMSISTNVPAHLSFTGGQIPDDWAQQYFGTNAVPDNGDADHDGLSNLQEYLLGTNPTNAYTAGDSIPDGWAVAHGLDPRTNIATNDPDGDGLNNLQEYLAGTDPNSADTDGDGISDNVELQNGTDPLLSDLIVTNGLVLDLDASRLAGFSDGDRVSWWPDRSGLGNDAYNPGSGAPVYRANSLLGGVVKPVLDFENACMQGWFSTKLTTTGLTAFVAMNAGSAAGANAGAFSIANYGEADDSSILSAALFIGDTPANLRWATRRANLLGSIGVGPLREDAWQILATRFDGTTNTLYVGGVAQPSAASSGVFGSDSFTVGRRQPLTSYVNGQYGEILVYNRALSDAERQQVESYLRHKWLSSLSSNNSSIVNPPSACLAVSLISPTNGAAFAPGESITLSASVSDTTTVRKVEFYAGNTLLATSHVSPFTSSVSLSSGDYSIAAKAYGGDGTVVDSMPVSITITLDSGSLQAWWPLNQPSGNTVADVSGNGHTANLMNGPSWIGTTNGAALLFDGVDDFGTALIDVSETNYAVSFWFRTTSANAGLYVVVDGDLGNGGSDRTLYLNGGNLSARTWNSEVIATTGLNLADGAWHHVVHSYGGAAGARGGQRIYVDGVLKAVGIKAQSDFYWQKRVNFGYCPDAAQPFFKGQMTDVRVYTQAISPAVAAALARLSPAQTGPDTDGDGLPDGWEMAFFGNLNQGQNDDPDHDGLSNLQEYRLGTNPMNSDTDGDGMPDGWEIQKGFNPMDSSDAARDADGDGLSNVAEYQAGTNPLLADTDGDGISDYDRLLRLDQNPAYGVTPGDVTVAAEIAGSLATNCVGDWEVFGDQIRSAGLRGGLTYVINVPTTGVYRVAVIGGGVLGTMARLISYIDDQFVGTNSLFMSSDCESSILIYPPLLTAGEHRVTIIWDNLLPGPELWIKAVRLEAVGGPDANGNGLPDWVDQRYARIATLDERATSFVSPYCAEGTAKFLSSLALNYDVQPSRGAGDRWYANVPLLDDTNTEVIAKFDGGIVCRTNHVTWLPFNILKDSAPVIRAGDALRLTAQSDSVADGMAWIIVAGLTNYQTQCSQPVKQVFPVGGQYLVTGVCSNSAGMVTNSVTIKVVSASLPPERPAAWLNRTRTWTCPSVPSDSCFVEADPSMTVMRYGTGAGGSAINITAGDIEWPHAVVLRTEPGGSIIDARPIDGFWVHANSEGFYPVVEKTEDGSRIIRNTMIARKLPESVVLYTWFIIGGVTFDDGAGARNNTLADFLPDGEMAYYLVISPSGYGACHGISAYQNGAYLGRR